jgi:cyclopropane fatty-acyl-phospholipid synthase-like methyltransferase
MKTDTKEYHDYLEKRYLLGRSYYLKYALYPRLFREFHTNEPIIDLGCGTGEFLSCCKQCGWKCVGIDSNESLVMKCVARGHDARVDNLCHLSSLQGIRFSNAISDNVIEHLDANEIALFFRQVEALLSPHGVLVCIVPGPSGFKRDVTHKTYVDGALLSRTMINTKLKVTKAFFHPINIASVATVLYLNMQVFVIRRRGN